MIEADERKRSNLDVFWQGRYNINGEYFSTSTTLGGPVSAAGSFVFITKPASAGLDFIPIPILHHLYQLPCPIHLICPLYLRIIRPPIEPGAFLL